MFMPNFTAIPAEFLNPYTNPVWSYTMYCLAWAPCTPCYDAPRRPGPAGEPAVQVPRDAILQQNFSAGWWYMAATLHSVTDSSDNVDVVLSQSYNNPPKASSGSALPFLTKSAHGHFSVQTSLAHTAVLTEGAVTNKFAPDARTGVSPDPWEAVFKASNLGLNMNFKLTSGEVGKIGARYAFVGSAADGAEVSLVGRDVSGIILQGDRGFIGVAMPDGVDADFLAGTNYFSLRLDISGFVRIKGVRTLVSGTADFDFQWLNGNPSPRNQAVTWAWFNFRLPGGCNLFINQQRLANGSMVTGPGAESYSLLNSPDLPSAGPGLPARHKQLPQAELYALRTWKSPNSNITYPSSVVLKLGDYAEFILIPHFEDGEIGTATPILESGVRVVVLKSSAEYERDCPVSRDDSSSSSSRDSDSSAVNVGIMEFNGFNLNTVPVKGLLEGGSSSNIVYE